jgi:hypothetical protein
MKKIFLSICIFALFALTVAAQTLNVVVGDVVYQFPAADAGTMNYSEGSSLTVEHKTFAVSDITRMFVDATEVDSSTVSVVYGGSSAKVYVAGDIAHLVTPTISGAHVSIAQSDDVDREITYSLAGESSDGEFYMSGSYKATVELRGLTLTNATPVYSGAAVCIMNGKRINLSVKAETANTLTDCASPSDALAQKSALYCKGHLELKGRGLLTVNGKYAHAIKSAEYMQMKNASINVAAAVKDGISCDEYFLMESGTLTIKSVGDDGIQCDIDGDTSTGETADHEDEDSGNIYINGGTLDITTTAAGTKCIKADSTLVVNDGILTLNASGAIDTSDATDPSYSTALRGGKVVINGGTVTATVKGTAGRGVSAWDIETNGGSLTINNSATPTTISSDVKSAKGLKALNMALNAGTITINMTGNAGKGIKVGSGTQSTSGGGGWGGGGGRPGGGGGMGGGSTWTNIKGSYTQGKADGSGPTIVVNTTGSAYSSSNAKAIKAICAAYLYGGTTEVSTKTSGAEGLESKSGIYVEGGNHYFKCYDDCMNSAGKIVFNGGATVCYGYGNDSVDSNAGTSGAITIGNGAVFAYTTKGAPEEGFDCDNNSYIQITGTGIGISAGANQGGGGGGWGGSSSGSTISNAKQGYAFVTSSISYAANRYYTLADASGNNLVTYSFEAGCNSSLALFTATGMVKGSSYNVKYSTSAPTDATTAWHGLYLGSSAKGTTAVTTFTAK